MCGHLFFLWKSGGRVSLHLYHQSGSQDCNKPFDKTRTSLAYYQVLDCFIYIGCKA